MQSLKSIIFSAILCWLLTPGVVQAQSFQRGGSEFNAIRTVTLSPGKFYGAVVVEFYHHGQIASDGRNVIVVAKQQLVPCRILQLGPGDFCRLAFQPIKGQLAYEILYGGEPPSELAPAWTCQDGLLLETRHFKNCNLHNLNSVRKAFETSTPLGSDYVEGVFHGQNPFSLKREPFISRYTGYLHIPATRKYGFWTASQDASFLLIDDKLVVSAPGRHGPMRLARPDRRGDAELSAGLHKFEYYHVATGPDAIMAAYCAPDPGDKARAQVIPPTFFNAQNIAHWPAKNLTLRTAKPAPDFIMVISGAAPLPDRSLPLIDVLFRDASPKNLTAQGKVQWDFGDGQTSDEPNPEHVYLRPGLYTVTLSVRAFGKNHEIANRMEIDQPALDRRDKLDTIDDYLKLLETYNPHTLDAVSLQQLVLVYEAKASKLFNRAEDAENAPPDPNRRADDLKDQLRRQKAVENFSSDARRYLLKAVNAGKAAFADESVAEGDEDLIQIAQIISPIARYRLDDSQEALQIWQAAAQRIKSPASRAECQVAAADILINDLLKAQDGKPLLDEAVAALGKGASGPRAANLQRVWGDYCAAVGNGQAARDAYLAAEQDAQSGRNFIQRSAWKGAYSRSTEEFIKSGQLVRAAEELQAWQNEFPGEKIEGYLTLLLARYWAAREKYAQAVAQAEQLQAVNPDSSYADQILLLAADCELRRGRKDRAVATLHSILKEYPGSPIVPLVKKNLDALGKIGE
jgi:TolA-binding protein